MGMDADRGVVSPHTHTPPPCSALDKNPKHLDMVMERVFEIGRERAAAATASPLPPGGTAADPLPAADAAGLRAHLSALQDLPGTPRADVAVHLREQARGVCVHCAHAHAHMRTHAQHRRRDHRAARGSPPRAASSTLPQRRPTVPLPRAHWPVHRSSAHTLPSRDHDQCVLRQWSLFA